MSKSFCENELFNFDILYTNFVSSWELNTKPMKTIYQGLANRSLLTSLKIEFPMDRIPKPTVTIPGMSHLKYLHLANLDPLCYNDDISLLLYESQELETLKLHWNPRMRNEREPSVNLRLYFGLLMSSPRFLKLKHLGMANLFSRNESELAQSISFDTIHTLTFINCTNQDNPATIFTDKTWSIKDSPEGLRSKLISMKVIRSDQAGTGFSKLVGLLSNLEEMYLLTPGQCPREGSIPVSPHVENNSSANGNRKETPTPSEVSNGVESKDGSTPVSSDSNNVPNWNHPKHRAKYIMVASDYIAAVITHHAATIKKLLLPAQWSLNRDLVLNLVTSCPNLTQLAVSVDDKHMEVMRAICGAGQNLTALRLLVPKENDPWKDVHERLFSIHTDILSIECKKDAYNNIQLLGIASHIVELCGMESNPKGSGQRRKIRAISWDDPRVQQVEIFGLDNKEL
jgi:hypothetical protein